MKRKKIIDWIIYIWLIAGIIILCWIAKKWEMKDKEYWWKVMLATAFITIIGIIIAFHSGRLNK